VLSIELPQFKWLTPYAVKRLGFWPMFTYAVVVELKTVMTFKGRDDANAVAHALNVAYNLGRAHELARGTDEG
jgi:hypothetical protein